PPRDNTSAVDNESLEGSPLIMLKSLMNHDRFRNGSLARIEFVFLFIELDEINHRLLKEKLDEYQSSVPIWPTNIKLFVKPCRFEDMSKNGIEEYILNAPIGRNLRQATFLFVYPFGFTGFSMAL